MVLLNQFIVSHLSSEWEQVVLYKRVLICSSGTMLIKNISVLLWGVKWSLDAASSDCQYKYVHLVAMWQSPLWWSLGYKWEVINMDIFCCIISIANLFIVPS